MFLIIWYSEMTYKSIIYASDLAQLSMKSSQVSYCDGFMSVVNILVQMTISKLLGQFW